MAPLTDPCWNVPEQTELPGHPRTGLDQIQPQGERPLSPLPRGVSGKAGFPRGLSGHVASPGAGRRKPGLRDKSRLPRPSPRPTWAAGEEIAGSLSHGTGASHFVEAVLGKVTNPALPSILATGGAASSGSSLPGDPPSRRWLSRTGAIWGAVDVGDQTRWVSSVLLLIRLGRALRRVSEEGSVGSRAQEDSAGPPPAPRGLALERDGGSAWRLRARPPGCGLVLRVSAKYWA